MVSKGFKQTEIGLLPEEWSLEPFSDIAILKHGFQFLEEHFTKTGIGVIKIGNLKDGCGLNLSDLTYVQYDRIKRFDKFKLKQGDVLMALTGATLGKVCLVNTDIPLLQNYRVGNFIPKEKTIRKFIYQICQSAIVQQFIKDLVNSGAQPNLGKKDFDKILIPLPPKPEQEAIAKVLSDTDTLIEKLEQLIAKKRNVKTATMQQLLKPKEGWEVKKLGEIFSILKGKGLSKSVINEYGSYQCILYGELFTTYKEIIDEIKSRTNTYEGIKSEKGDILFPGSTTTIGIDLAKSSVLMVRDVLLGGDIIILRRKSNVILPEYAVYFINVERKKQIAEKTKGITIYHLHGKDLYDIEIQYPSISEQTRIAQILSDMDNEIEALEKKLNKYKMLKQGLMQVLLTGKIRLV